MSIGSQTSRPSAHPLVSSRSAPQLSPAASTQDGGGAPVARRTPPPESPPGRVRQLHPTVAGPGPSPDAKHDAKHPGSPLPALAHAGRGLVRFVGTFLLDQRTAFEEDSDALTALTESVQRSVQQQPDTATASSGEATPHESDSTQ